jgi:methylmalonyl-CoA/ethylmalonyl-CoA epimerase
MSSDNQPTRRMHHLGYVVPSISEVVEGVCRSIDGSHWSRTWHDPIQRVQVAFIYARHPGSPSLELVEPEPGESPVRKFLERGGGLHHICYEVADIEAECREAPSRGLVLLRRPQPAEAFGGLRIAWVMTKEKLLIEYLEAADFDGA